jgi:hypothetical protein
MDLVLHCSTKILTYFINIECSIALAPVASLLSVTSKANHEKFDGVTKSGELLLVLARAGPSGAGRSTLLKSTIGELHGPQKNSEKCHPLQRYSSVSHNEGIKGELVRN